MNVIMENIDVTILYKVGYTLIAIILMSIITKSISKVLHKKIEDVHKYYRIKTNLTYVKYFFLCLFFIGIWFESGSSITTYLGLLSAGLAVALKDFIVNIASWLFIVWRKPFEVGDRIEIGDSAGDVIDQRIFQFTLNEIGNWVEGDQSTGRIIHIPNSRVLTEAMSNYTKGFPHIWNELDILVTFESDWSLAKSLLQDIANQNSQEITKEAEKKIKEAAKKFMIFYNTLTPIVYTSIQDSGVKLSIRYLCLPHNRRTSSQKMYESILKEFDKYDNINLAYNTFRMVK